jgi:hypothetical protein
MTGADLITIQRLITKIRAGADTGDQIGRHRTERSGI